MASCRRISDTSTRRVSQANVIDIDRAVALASCSVKDVATLTVGSWEAVTCRLSGALVTVLAWWAIVALRRVVQIVTVGVGSSRALVASIVRDGAASWAEVSRRALDPWVGQSVCASRASESLRTLLAL